jgi:hypothetical protein
LFSPYVAGISACSKNLDFCIREPTPKSST